MAEALTQSSARILVVDDEPVVRGLIARWLSDAGYHCAMVGDAREAWQYLQSHEVDVVTSDISMPGLSGVDLLKQIVKSYPDMGVLMLTALGDSSTAIDALTHGAWGYLIKPVERKELLFHVKQAVERRQLLLERRDYTRCLERRILEQTVAIRRAHEETILRLLSAAMYRDEETGAHVRRTGLFSEVLAAAAGWSLAQMDHLRMAAPMHDVGKIGIPDAILRKPGMLTEEEYEVMKTHTTIGAQMLDNSTSPVLKLGHEIALNHHERWDGLGYPAGRRETDIPESSRIVSIVDVYDALTHDRVYRPALEEQDALSLMEQGRGTHFDPQLLDLFFLVLPEIRRIADENPDSADSSDMPDRVHNLLAAWQREPGRQPAEV